MDLAYAFEFPSGAASRMPRFFAQLRQMFAVASFSVIGSAAIWGQAQVSEDSIREGLGITKRLSCSLSRGNPLLLFDFRLHSPYRVTVPAKELRESKELFMRVFTQPLKDGNGKEFSPPIKPYLMIDRFQLADFPMAARNDLQVNGSVATGEGEYRHFVSIDDGHGLGCVMDWKVKARADGKITEALALNPGEVADPRTMIFARQQPVEKTPDGLRLAIFVNADNRSWRRTVTDGGNVVALSASLRKFAEDRRVNSLSVTVFSLEDQRVLYEQEYAPTIPFRRLGASIRQMKPGEVDISDLTAKSEAVFFGQLVKERETRIREADLVVFIGARSPVIDKAPASVVETLRGLGDVAAAYLVTNPFRWRSPIDRDVIGHLVKALDGKEREIRLPSDLAKAVDAVLSAALERRKTVAQQR